MNSLPDMLSDVLEELYKPITTSLNEDFKLDLLEYNLSSSQSLVTTPLKCCKETVNDSGISSLQNNECQFKVKLDLKQFKLEEISVRAAGDYIIVEAKHEKCEKKFGMTSHHLTQRYKVPRDVNFFYLKSTLSHDGILTIEAPKIGMQINDERYIPIVPVNELPKN